ncbi:MAG TPA: nucleotide disphospho-sugar-binding domain-containing protein [Thermoleophilaceae bacterium]
MIALGRELVARGHEVVLQTWEKWRPHVEAEGMTFDRAPEYQVWPTSGEALKPYQAAVRAAEETVPLVRSFDPHAVVADILTSAAALAAKMDERPWATLVPHVLPQGEPGWPVYSTGARLPRTAAGRRFWRLFEPLTAHGARQGREQLNEARRRVGLPPFSHVHGGTSRELALIATFPQLEYPREQWEPWMKVTGPLLWEQPNGDVEPPAGDDPLVLIAPSTSQDPDQRMLRAALEGLADEPVRVLASTNRRSGLPQPRDAKLVDWLSYSRAMPLCSAVVCHAGHGTVARALTCGVPLVACPAGGDMAETTARVAWAGAGVGLPRRLTTPRGVRLAVRKVLAEPGYRERAREIAAWSAAHDGPACAADELERFATLS